MSTYNKTCEHQVVYIKKCNDNDLLGIAETILLKKINKYREKANRDRFVLPVDKNISYFTNIIDNIVNYLNGIFDIEI